MVDDPQLLLEPGQRLVAVQVPVRVAGVERVAAEPREPGEHLRVLRPRVAVAEVGGEVELEAVGELAPRAGRDRKSVVSGKSVDLGGGRIIKKTKSNRTSSSAVARVISTDVARHGNT